MRCRLLGGIVDKPNIGKNTPAWIVAVSKGALILAPLGSFGCYGADANDAATANTSEVVKESPPVVLTPAEETEYVVTVDQSRDLLEKGEAQESLAVLERSAELNPNSFAVHNNYCVAYGNLGLRDQAIAECQRALDIEPDNQLGKNNLNWVTGLTPVAPTEAAPTE
jgi:tetratricopeptide (TPR) repeat protein